MATILGILSDTHGHAANAAAGLAVLQEAGATTFAHCGDVGDGESGRAVCDVLAGTDCRLVPGNNDWDYRDLASYARDLELQPMDALGEFTVAGRSFALTHGDDHHLLRQLLARPLDYLLTGHSHEPHDRPAGQDGRADGPRWINPGALWRAKPKTVATLIVETGKLTHLQVPGI
ncbi:MAG: metallophosphoesterase family protein [Planctomycetota bacterium]